MSLTIILLVVVVVAVTSLYLKWRQVKNYWKKRGVPHSPPHPILGSLTFLQKQNVALWMRGIYDKFKSPYVGIWLFWRPAVIINSYEIAQRILIKDFDCFRNRLAGTGLAETDPIGGLNIFSLDDPQWSSVRRKLTPVFTSAKLKNMHGLFSTKSKALAMRVDQDTRNKKPLELRSLYADYTTDIIGIASFGVDSNATLTGDSPMRKVTKEFMRFTYFRGMAWGSIFFFPELCKWFKFTFFPKESSDYFTKVYTQIVKQRGGYNGKSEYNDLLDALRKMKYDAISNNEDMDENLVIAQAVIFLQAGFDTSAGALTYATYELAYNPDIQQRVYEELVLATQKNENKEFDYDTYLKDIPYFNCVMKEVLRRYTALGWLDRICDRDYRLDENLTIAKGTTVYVNAVGMHHDPSYYPDPDTFNPDRFLEDDVSQKPYMPFGDGPRACIGTRFSYRTTWYALYEVMMKFEFRPIPGTKKPADLEVEKLGLLYMPGEPLHVQFIPRN